MIKINYTSKDWALMLAAIATLFFLVVSFLVDDYRNAEIRSSDVERIQNVLHKQQENSRLFIEEHLPHAVANRSFDSCWSKSLQDKGVSLFILKKDSIVYWSDNLYIDNYQLNLIDTTEQYVNIGNGWYVAKAFTDGDYKAITLILIRTEYIYHNDFLKNSFNPIFNFSKNSMIAPIGSDEGALISGISGAPLFIITAEIIPGQFKKSTLYRWLAIFATLILFTLIFYDWSKWGRGLQPLFVAFSILLVIRLLIFYNESYFQEGISLFSPTLYAASSVLKSLGDLLLHLIFIFIFLLIVYRNSEDFKRRIDKLSNNTLHIYRLTSVSIVACVAWIVNYIIGSLVLNSNISFEAYRISNLSVYTFIAFFVILLLLTILFILIHLQTRLFANKSKESLLISQIIVFAVLSIIFINGYTIGEYIFVFVFLIINIISVYNLSKANSGFKYFLVITVLLSVYTTVMMLEKMNEREQQKLEVWAQSLSAERDLAAEMLLREIEDKMSTDTYLQQTLTNKYISERVLFDRLMDYHFKGYFQNYEIQFNVCSPQQLLHRRIEDDYVDCYNFFNQEREKYGIQIQGSSHFWFMNNGSGRVCYYGEFKMADPETGKVFFIFINLFSKPESESIGYPELLLDSKMKSNNKLGINYSYAKYRDGELVSHAGAYDYSLNLNLQITRDKNRYFLVKNDYSHYIHKTGNNNVVVISRPKIRFIDAASLFSYNTVLLFIGLFCLLVLVGYPFNVNITKLSYKRKITYVLLASITISLTVLTITVLYFMVRQSEEKNAISIQDKLRSVMIELDQSHILISDDQQKNKYLTYVLVNLSNSFYTDINLYNRNGHLIASSRDEIFEKKLLGTKMNRQAYVSLTMEAVSKYIHWEQIGSMRYYSAYAPYYNSDRELLAYINMPYFFKQSTFREEITQLIANIANIYILLILLGTVFALFISNQLLRPLGAVQQKMGRLDLTHQPEKIDYRGNDEIGDLVREYNRMIGELAENAKKLATTERESAWREMARQIAHEIKNPLTPMRLSIQHVVRMKENSVQGWEEKFDAIAKSLLDQIEILSKIASEFSSFARINEREREPIDLSIALHNSINLFRVYDNVEFDLHIEGDSPKYIMANNDQLQRVFTNLIKNAVQAVENNSNGLLEIILKEEKEQYILSFEDNGIGIPPELQKRLFQPNFTTKSGGTGLGLAISKNIVESFGGSISFKKGKSGGACFVIQFPICNIGLELLRKL